MKKTSELLSVLTAFLLFLVMRPSFTWGMGDMMITTSILLLIIILHVDLRCKNNTILLLLFVAIIASNLFVHGRNIFGFLQSEMIAFVPFMKKDFSRSVYIYFEKIIVWVMAVSIVFWLLVVVIGLHLPHIIIEPLNDLKSYNYLSYLFLVVPTGLTNIINSIRFCSVFDEPGVVGTCCVLMLYINSFDFSKFKNIILLIAGLISFSLFFYITLFVFLLIKVFLQNSLKKYRVIAVVLVIIAGYFLTSNSFLSQIIGYRFEYNKETKSLVGDNRSTEQLSDHIAAIRWTDAYYWGDKRENVEYYAENAGLNTAILRYGIIFLIGYFVFFFLFSQSQMKGQHKEIVFFMLLLLLTLYQRPGLLSPHYLFLFTCCVHSRIEKNGMKPWIKYKPVFISLK